MRINKIFYIFVSLLGALGIVSCASTGGEIRTTLSAEVTELPNTIAVYPLLTSTPKPGVSDVILTSFDTGTMRDESNIYISPPTDFTLSITLHSQMMTDALAAELSSVGFSLKQLPIVIPDENDTSDDGVHKFAVSLELLRHMKENMNLKALLIGNVLLEKNRSNPSSPLVKRLYLRLVDVETMDLLCFLSISDGSYGRDMEDVVRDIANELSVYRIDAAPADTTTPN